jgi:hypothetical protein
MRDDRFLFFGSILDLGRGRFQYFLTEPCPFAKICVCQDHRFLPVPDHNHGWVGAVPRILRATRNNSNRFGPRCCFARSARRQPQLGNASFSCSPVGISTNISAPSAAPPPVLKPIKLKAKSVSLLRKFRLRGCIFPAEDFLHNGSVMPVF